MDPTLPPQIGMLESGPRGTLCDVPGVTVGHCTVAAGAVQTGVTVIRPHPEDPFLWKVPAAAVVLNGFGKSIGLEQIRELGVLESPIALTNTFAAGPIARGRRPASAPAISNRPWRRRRWSSRRAVSARAAACRCSA